FILAPERFTVTASPEIESSRLHEHAFADSVLIKKLVTGNRYAHDLKALALRDDVLDCLQIVLRGQDAEIDIDVVIALAFEVLAQVALAFHEQVIIDCPLFENRYVSLENALRGLGLDCLDLHLAACPNRRRRLNT